MGILGHAPDQSPNQIGAIDKFRLALSERQAIGCLQEIENEHLRRTIVEYFPLPPAIAYFLRCEAAKSSFDL
jgi:hypothetical protein